MTADEEESQGRKRVVVFDDDLELAAAVREGLQSQYDVGIARDLYHLIELLTAGADVLILDLNLKGYTGTDVFEAINKDFPEIRVILFTGFAEGMPDQLEAARRAGLHHILHKPASVGELRAAIRVALEK